MAGNSDQPAELTIEQMWNRKLSPEVERRFERNERVIDRLESEVPSSEHPVVEGACTEDGA